MGPQSVLDFSRVCEEKTKEAEQNIVYISTHYVMFFIGAHTKVLN